MTTNVQPTITSDVPSPQPQIDSITAPTPTSEAEPVVETVQDVQPETITIEPGSNEELMQQAGIAVSDYQAVDYIVFHESTWNPLAVNSIGATGLCQALPATKMASEGEDYMTNPVTQLRWCQKYALQRYGSWQAALAFWQANTWW